MFMQRKDNSSLVFPDLPERTPVYVWNQYTEMSYIACEFFGKIVLVHFYIPEENKTKENIDTAKYKFFPELVKELRNLGYKCITTNCDAKDTKTAQLFEQVGFKTKTMTAGLYIIPEED